MQKYLKYLNTNSVCLALILCLGGLSLIPRGTQDPDPLVPPVVSLVDQVKQDLAGEKDKAEKFAGLYEAAALMARKTQDKPQVFFARVPVVLQVLEISDPELSKTVGKHLEPWSSLKEWDDQSREAFSKAVQELADACKEVK
jgi:hypothetical protein